MEKEEIKHSVYKYPLEMVHEQTISMPKGSKILSVQRQNKIPCIWALVNPNEEENEEKKILLIETGNIFNSPTDKLNFIGTLQFIDGSYILHVFEIKD